MHDSFSYVLFAIYILVVLCSTVLNGSILVAFCAFRFIRQKRFGILISLAIADFLKVVPLAGEIVVLWQTEENINFTACLTVSTIGLYLICVTILHLVLESINRLITIARPLRYHQILTAKIFGTLLTMAWILPALGIILPHAFLPSEKDWEPSFRVMMFVCDPKPMIESEGTLTTDARNGTAKGRNVTLSNENLTANSEISQQLGSLPITASIISYSAIVTTVYFIIPLITMIISYSIIFKISLRHIRQINSVEKNMRHLYHRISKPKMPSAFGSDAGISTASSITSGGSVVMPQMFIASHVRTNSNEREGSDTNEHNEENHVVGVNRTPKELPLDTVDSNLTNNNNIAQAGELKEDEHPNISNFTSKFGQENMVTAQVMQQPDKSLLSKEDESAIANNIPRRKSITRVTFVEDRRKAWQESKSSNVAQSTDINNNGVKKDAIFQRLSSLQSSHRSTDVVSVSEISYSTSRNSSARRNSIVPLTADDVMSFDHLASTDSWYTGRKIDKKEPKGQQPFVAVNNYIYDVTEEETRGIKDKEAMDRVYENEDGGVFMDDHQEALNDGIKKNGEEDHPCPPVKKAGGKNQWKNISKHNLKKNRSEEPDKQSHQFPSEAFFQKILADLERRKPPSSFESSARRVMTFSALIRNKRRKSSWDDDELLPAPTAEEVDRLENLLSYAEKNSDVQVVSESDDTQHDGPVQNEQDAFGLFTGFPVMEAWAESLKARAMASSPNSFVRFYGIIRGEMRNRKKEGKLVKTLGGLIAALMVFYIPITLFSWERLGNWPTSDGEEVARTLLLWALLSSALNPIIYCLRIPEFKKAFLRTKQNLIYYFTDR
eukprot:Seg4295.2 transcript_id=Seg4295.2/GoldUCD/mRNA.D3Y31 product="D-like dopamine receptor" protein_id=Seg4295.2/GoldUCD/D3Y31